MTARTPYRIAPRIARRGALGLLMSAAAGTIGRADETGDKAAARQPPFRITMILWRGETPVEQGFRDYLHDQDIPVEITVENIAHDLSLLPGVIAKIHRSRPDLVYTWGTSITMGVVGQYDRIMPDSQITDLPVLFSMVTSATGSRIIDAPGASGRNVTGVSHIAPLESQIKAMQAYRQLSRLAVIFNPVESNSVLTVGRLQILLANEKIDLIKEPVPLDAQGRPRADVLPDLVAKVAQREPQFLYIGPDTFIGENADVVTGEGIRLGLPTFTGTELEIVSSRAMAGLVTKYYALGKFAGFRAKQILVDRIPIGEIPIETMQKFNYIVKISVARELGLYPPMQLLDYAEIVS